MVNVLYYNTIQDLINSTTTPDINTKIVVLGYHDVKDNGGGTFYWVPGATESDDGGTIFSITAFSTGKYKRIIGGDKIKAAWFGAKADGVTDDTQALKNALLYVRDNRTSPSGTDSRGQNTIILDKGEYLITSTLTDNSQSHLGFSIIGAGEFATQITFENDTDPLFNFNSYINISFKEFSIFHKPNEETSENLWTNSSFFLRGQGGGRRFTLENITIINFDTQIRHDDTDGFNGNGDTNLFIGCTFQKFNTFLYSRNSQSVVNEYLQCTWSGGGNVFDIAGYGFTQINGGNIVVGGTWFKFANVQERYGYATSYILNNVKGEYALNKDNNVTTRIVDANGSDIQCRMIFNNCGIGSATPAPDPNFKTFVFGASKTQVTFNGGAYLDTSIETIGYPTIESIDHNFIKFIGCRNTTDPINITRTGNESHPSITYLDCLNRTNTTLLSNTTYVASPMHTNTVTRTLGRLVGGNGESEDQIDFYGQETVIDEIMVAINANPNDTGTKTIEIYEDSDRTILLSTLTLPGSTNGEVGFFDDMKGQKFTDGLYFKMMDTVGTTFGKIIIRSFNI